MTELRKVVRKSLPDYMVPQFFVEISAVPMTPNGKVNRKRLTPPQTESDTEKPFPETENERLVAAVWTKVLDTENIGRFDNFFDLGGHSLLAVKVAKQIEQETGKRLELRRFVMEDLAQISVSLSEQQSKPMERTGWHKRLLGRLVGGKVG